MSDAASSIKSLRKTLSLTQEGLADALGVSFASVNRWENGQRKPSALALKKLADLEAQLTAKNSQNAINQEELPTPQIDFSANPQAVKAIIEAQRLAFAHTINPVFATEVSRIDPLPHQRIAVYEKILEQPRIRFLLADDAGAGKTIMSGLVIREMLSRQRIKRVLIVPPAGLVGNWQRELKELFQIDAKIATGKDISAGNPFTAENGILIVSIDTLRSSKARILLQDQQTIPYNLVIFDEAHKLSCSQGADFKIDKSKRYKLAEMLAGADDNAPSEWRLSWHPEHLLLLTATPHMGKDYPYFALWKLLEPHYFTTPEVFNTISENEKSKYFIRRTKEEMVHIDGRPLYPMRISDTFGFTLSQGKDSEQELYDATTDYLINIYNKALRLNSSAAGLAMSVFQRRLSSSTYALRCSFERRLAKIDQIIQDIIEGKITERQLIKIKNQRIIDVFEEKTADEEAGGDFGKEENEKFENEAIEQIICSSLADLQSEQEHVKSLLGLADRVLKKGGESKFERLLEIMKSPQFKDEKILIFTEHKDTLEYIYKKLENYGYTNQLAQIHGGMDSRQRMETIDQFRKPIAEGGAKYMICTDAASEGVNLQFCWIMINYDIPWNPARLEQRMGRIHRYGQVHDPVFLLNLVSKSTREGKVLATLLEKLERIRQELSSDKVFDSIGRVFNDVSIKRYMEKALLAAQNSDMASLTDELEGEITEEQITSAYVKEARIFGDGGDVASKLPALREKLFCEDYRRLLPGFVEGFMRMALPLLGIQLHNSHIQGCYRLDASKSSHASDIYSALAESGKEFITFSRVNNDKALWAHPGEPFFCAVARELQAVYGRSSLSGGIFIDPFADKSYTIHVALFSILHGSQATPTWHLVALKHYGANFELCSPEEFLCIKSRNSENIPTDAQKLAANIKDNKKQAEAFLLEYARKQALAEKDELNNLLPEKEKNITRGFKYQNAELSERRAALSKKRRTNAEDVEEEFSEVKAAMRGLAEKQEEICKQYRDEIEQIMPGEVKFLAHALILPETNPQNDDTWKIDNVEELAMQIVRAYEQDYGQVNAVHTPELALSQGLQPRPGFDVLSLRKGGNRERRCIEVKGTKGDEFVCMTENEWCHAMNLADEYWLYIVANCASAHPRLLRIQNPVRKFYAEAIKSNRTSHKIKISEVAALAERD